MVTNDLTYSVLIASTTTFVNGDDEVAIFFEARTEQFLEKDRRNMSCHG
jgi:hypothetical protein